MYLCHSQEPRIMKRFFITLFIISIVMGCKNNETASVTARDAVLENIMTRTSIRAYTDQPVPEEMVETMLKAGMAAPTAMNRQPWEFIVVTDRAKLDEMADSLKYAKMLRQAPLAIVVGARNTFVNRDGNTVVNMFWVDDCSAATENILLAAHAMGLGAVWTAAKDEERASAVRAALDIPMEFAPLCVIPIGFPAENPEPKDKWKPEKIRYNNW